MPAGIALRLPHRNEALNAVFDVISFESVSPRYQIMLLHPFVLFVVTVMVLLQETAFAVIFSAGVDDPP